MFSLGRFRLDLISDGFFETDADTFIKECLKQQTPAHLKARSKPRFRVGFNSLLIRGNGHTVVVDPGTGDKPRAEKIVQYRLEWPRRFLHELKALGVAPETVDTVILSHLHWDHAGASTQIGKNGEIIPTFSKAQYYVQSSELDAARMAVRSNDDSYCAEDFEPLSILNRLNTVGPEAEIVPGISVQWVGGHCAGLQIIKIESEQRRAIYLSDLVPTTAQLPLDCAMTYDEDIPRLRDAKETVLAEAADHEDLLLFVHAPRNRAGYLRRYPGGGPRFESVEI